MEKHLFCLLSVTARHTGDSAEFNFSLFVCVTLMLAANFNTSYFARLTLKPCIPGTYIRKSVTVFCIKVIVIRFIILYVVIACTLPAPYLTHFLGYGRSRTK